MPGPKCLRQPRYQKRLKELKVYKPQWKTSHEDVRKMEELKRDLQQTYAAIAEKFHDWRHLSAKQLAFAKHYAKNGRSSVLGAMRRAGYDYDDNANMSREGRRMLERDDFQALVTAFEFEEKARMKLTVEDVVKWFNDIATAAMASGDFTNANRAMENLAKYLGMFIEKREITHHVVHNKEELDARISELTAILKEAEPEIEAKLRIN